MTSPIKLRNGKLLLSTEAPGGIYNAAQLKQIAQLCEGDVSLVRATEDQRLALIVESTQVASVTETLQVVGLQVRSYQEGLHQPTACVGELCSESEQDALGDAMEITAAIETISLQTPLKIGVNGCARCCVPCHTLDIAIVGEAAGYRISLGGKNSQIPELASYMAEGVPAAELAGVVAKVVQTYAGLAQAEETLQEVLERCGGQAFIEALAPYSQDAVSTADAETMSTTTTVTEEMEMIGDDLSLKDDGSKDQGGGDVDIDPRQFMGNELDQELPIQTTAGEGEAAAADDISPNLTDDLATMEPELISTEAEGDPSTLPQDDDLARSQSNETHVDESALEDKLNQAIAEEEEIGELEDDTAEERDATMRLVEQVTEEPIMEEASIETDVLDVDSDFAALDAAGEDEVMRQQIGGEWMLSGVDINDRGKLVIQFSSGASLQVDAAQIMHEGTSRSFNFGGTKLVIKPAGKGLQVVTDGMELFVPMSQSAAA